MGKKKKILITGAGGFIGRETCSYLSTHGYNVYGLIRKPLDEKGKVPGVTYLLGNMQDKNSLFLASKNVDYIIHLAGAKLDEKDSFQTNVEGAENLIATAQKNKVKAIVYISTLSTKIKQKGAYAQTKLTAENLFLKCGIPTVILRPSVIYGNKTQGVFGSIVKGTKFPFIPVFGNGNVRFYPIFLNDFIKCIKSVLRKGILETKAYDIGGKESITFNELIKKIAQVQDKTVVLIHLPPFIGIIAAKIFKLFLNKPPITESNILGSTQNVSEKIGIFYRDYPIETISLDKGLQHIFGSQLEKEGEALLSYVSSSNLKFSKKYSQLYIKAVKNNDMTRPLPSMLVQNFFLLKIADAISSVLYKNSLLQKKLFIASALFECSPESANKLLMQNKSFVKFLVEFSFAIGMFSLTFLIGIILLPFIKPLILYEQ